jgi:hypothetical protein
LVLIYKFWGKNRFSFHLPIFGPCNRWSAIHLPVGDNAPYNTVLIQFLISCSSPGKCFILHMAGKFFMLMKSLYIVI